MTSRPASAADLTRRPTTMDVDWVAAYAEHLPRIYNYFRFRLGSEADVEELTATTFEKAWRARQRYRSDLAAFSTWLFTIAQNTALDYLRARRTHLPIEAALDISAADTPEIEAQRASDLTRLAQLTKDLPDRERELIALKYGAALNNREISRITGLTESNVGTILHRLVQTLRSQW